MHFGQINGDTSDPKTRTTPVFLLPRSSPRRFILPAARPTCFLDAEPICRLRISRRRCLLISRNEGLTNDPSPTRRSPPCAISLTRLAMSHSTTRLWCAAPQYPSLRRCNGCAARVAAASFSILVASLPAPQSFAYLQGPLSTRQPSHPQACASLVFIGVPPNLELRQISLPPTALLIR